MFGEDQHYLQFGVQCDAQFQPQKMGLGEG